MSQHDNCVLPNCTVTLHASPHLSGAAKQHLNNVDRKTVLFTEMISEVTGRKLNTQLFGPNHRPLEPSYAPTG
jgi:hypothetical protein